MTERVELGTLTLIREDRDAVWEAVERYRPSDTAPEAYAQKARAGTPDDQIGRFRELAEAGLQEAIVNLPDLCDGGAESVARYAPIIAAFR